MEKETQAVESIVARCKQGDLNAARQLYEGYSAAMFQICRRMLGNVHDAEDVLQEAFYQVFTKIDKFRGEATIGAWIKAIVVHRCLDHLRKKKPLLVEADELPGVADSPVEEVTPAFTVERVKHAIARLPDGYRAVLSLYLFEEYSHREIAEKLGISESTAKTQYMRAKQKVRQLVAEMTPDLGV